MNNKMDATYLWDLHRFNLDCDRVNGLEQPTGKVTQSRSEDDPLSNQPSVDTKPTETRQPQAGE